MESSSSSSSFIYYWITLYFFRPILAVTFVISLILLGWVLAWKLVLVHVPLVQEICGLRKKPVKPKPPTRRLSRFYNTVDDRNLSSRWYRIWVCYMLLSLVYGKSLMCFMIRRNPLS